MDWQTIVAALIVLIASGYLIKALYEFLKNQGSLSGCGSCKSCPENQSQEFVEIELSSRK